MKPDELQDKQEKLQRVKLWFGCALLFFAAGGYFGFLESAELARDASAALRFFLRLALVCAAGLCGVIFFAATFAVVDVVIRTRRKLRQRLHSDPEDDE